MMMLAEVVAMRSTCSRLRVGCVLTDWEHSHVTVGYNGGPKGGLNGCRRDEPGNCGHVHAEINAIAKRTGREKVAYLTHAPCESCAIMLVNAGIERVYYGNPYRNPMPGIAVLSEAKVGIVCLGPNHMGWEWEAMP